MREDQPTSRNARGGARFDGNPAVLPWRGVRAPRARTARLYRCGTRLAMSMSLVEILCK